MRGLGKHPHNLSRDLELDRLRMHRVVVRLPIHQIETEATMCARSADLVADLRPNERRGRRGPRIKRCGLALCLHRT